MQYENAGAQIWYLFHSGFAVKTQSHFLIFDYYIDKPEGKLCGLAGGCIEPDEIKDRDVVVFCSHRHSDHYNPVIFTWRGKIPKLHYVMSHDIKRIPQSYDVLRAYGGHDYELGDMKIKVLFSTDVGVAYFIAVDGLTIYHAGDLNLWSWEGAPDCDKHQIKRRYMQEIDKLKQYKIDIAFVPLDPRLQGNYLLGLDYFMRNTDTEMVFPMHFGGDYSVFEWLKTDPASQPYRGKIMNITHRGQMFRYPKAKSPM